MSNHGGTRRIDECLEEDDPNDRFDPMTDPELSEITDPDHLEWRRQYQNDAAIIERLRKEGKNDELAEYINNLPD